MEVTITLNNAVIEMLEDWRAERLDSLQESIKRSEKELVKDTLIFSYKTIKNADYNDLAEMFLDYEEIERRYPSE